jgi:hypothetical protein
VPPGDRSLQKAELAEAPARPCVCIAAAQRRSILDEGEAKRHGKVPITSRRLPYLRSRAVGRSGIVADRLVVRGLRAHMTETGTAMTQRQKVLYVSRKAPYGTIYARALEVVLISAAFERVELAFLDDGVYQS